ncbi:MAG: hypothetical protein FWH10_08020 [Oscillospiraceae bacterium]|nr:hypothetical protein [Oscillospiraceae bacterium]
MKKTGIILLIFIFILTSFMVSCGSDSVPGGNNNAAGDNNIQIPDPENPEIPDEPGIKDSLPEGLDFGGQTLTVFAANIHEVYSEGEDGDIINDAIFQRNRAVEERLNLKINAIESPPWNEYETTLNLIRRSVLASDHAYDLIYGWSALMPHLSVENLFMDLNETPHLDLGAPWWNQSIINESTIAGELHFIVGDTALSLMQCYSAMLVNNELQKEYALPDIYDVVFDGKWTLDYMGDLVKSVHRDVNGDGFMDENDLFGVVFDNVNQIDAFMQSSNIKMISKNEEDIPYLDAEIEKLSSLVDKVYNLLYNNPGAIAFNLYEGEKVMPMFKNNQTLFAPILLDNVVQNFRDMEADYSIVPYPKYNETQDKYYSRIQDGVSLLCVPVTNNKAEMTGAFMEAMGSESYKNLTPVYFEIAMKVKYARDEVSSKMLDIVRDGSYLNFASIYNTRIGAPWNMLRDLMDGQNNNFASWYERNERAITGEINRIVEEFTKER